MIKSVRVEFQCDNCKSMAVTEGGPPEGWSEEKPNVLRGSVMYIDSPSGKGDRVHSDPHWCAECIAAAEQACDAALAARKR